MDFDKGDQLDEMHAHEPSSRAGSLQAFGYKPVSIIGIDDDLAETIGAGIGVPAAKMRRTGKTAYCVASTDDQVIVIYFYDSGFFMTTLTTLTPNG